MLQKNFSAVCASNDVSRANDTCTSTEGWERLWFFEIITNTTSKIWEKEEERCANDDDVDGGFWYFYSFIRIFELRMKKGLPN